MSPFSYGMFALSHLIISVTASSSTKKKEKYTIKHKLNLIQFNFIVYDSEDKKDDYAPFQCKLLNFNFILFCVGAN